jgi:carbamate kinase
MEKVLIAIGGNALYDKDHGNNVYQAMVKAVCGRIVEVIKLGYQPVITFGNGPQVGNLLDMAETSFRLFSEPVKLDACVSWTQGEIGYALEIELIRQLRSSGIKQTVMGVNTLVEVDPDDPAFQKPTKPVGKFISMDEAQQLFEERGWVVGPDANRGYRRLVPSPRPIRIVEADAIGVLIDAGFIILCGGGGGIPVGILNGPDQTLQGIEAVIDKDYTSCLIAKTLGIENLIICTEVEYVYLNYGTPEEKPLKRMPLDEAEKYMAEGHFAAGSMGPKVGALIDYVKHGGKRAFITSLDRLTDALKGEAGTEIYSEQAVPA